MLRRKFVILILVFTALVSLGWTVWRLANCGDDERPPTELLSLADPGAFPAEYRSAARAVANTLADTSERPAEFFAEVEESSVDGVVIFHLWHQSAWKSENRGVPGNPGGKCRDVRFDLNRRQVVGTLFWQ